MSEPGDRRSHWGVDIGGTTIVLGRLAEGTFTGASVLDMSRDMEPSWVLDQVAGTILDSDPTPSTLGVGIAGLVLRDQGILVSSPNLPMWKDFHVRDYLERKLECPVALDNDSNVFAIGAVRTGQIPGEGLWLMVTLGTGIGGTLVNDGGIIYGTGFAGEFGHMTVEASGIRCPCGSRGCWERYAASGALSRYYHSRSGRDLAPREISGLASNGDADALDAFREFGVWVGVGLANLEQCLSPEGIFMAGGLMGGSDHFLHWARKEFQGRCGRPWNVDVLPFSSDAGARGAAILGRELV